MTKVIAEISMSLDGFVTGPTPSQEEGLGRGGEDLHTWALDGDALDKEILVAAVQMSGSVIMGRRLFDFIDGPTGWNDEMGYGAGYATAPPFFVVTHSAPEQVRLDLDFTFVTSGLPDAVDQAREAAGSKDVVVMGGAEVIRQCVDEGLADELRIHLAPVILGGGTPLFVDARPRGLTQRSARGSSTATHLIYELK